MIRIILIIVLIFIYFFVKSNEWFIDAGPLISKRQEEQKKKEMTENRIKSESIDKSESISPNIPFITKGAIAPFVRHKFEAVPDSLLGFNDL